jgi:hypothetical protein
LAVGSWQLADGEARQFLQKVTKVTKSIFGKAEIRIRVELRRDRGGGRSGDKVVREAKRRQGAADQSVLRWG